MRDEAAPKDTEGLVGVVDVHYDDFGGARAALVVFADMHLAEACAEFVKDVEPSAPYQPGSFFERELPCVEAVLALGPSLGMLVVDGYATLDPDGRPGLGAKAAEMLGIPVIGVAKTPYSAATHAIHVVRGSATRPLYVTSAGSISADDAAQMVALMAGPHRLPECMKRTDQLARGLVSPRS